MKQASKLRSSIDCRKYRAHVCFFHLSVVFPAHHPCITFLASSISHRCLAYMTGITIEASIILTRQTNSRLSGLIGSDTYHWNKSIFFSTNAQHDQHWLTRYMYESLCREQANRHYGPFSLWGFRSISFFFFFNVSTDNTPCRHFHPIGIIYFMLMKIFLMRVIWATK